MKKIILLCTIAALLVACGQNETTATPAPAQPKPAVAATAPGTISGAVAETMNGGGYTYLRIGDQWAAIPEAKLREGDVVTLQAQMTMEQFESKTLNRKFDRIVFATLANAAPQGTPAQHMQARETGTDVKVEKAEGGKTIAEVWSAKESLRDQPVVVRGKVVKFLGGIMGKNWLHLRDGSGSPEKGDNDLTVTTSETAAVGDVVTIKGILRTDKDFGAGYRYEVIIEEAGIVK